MYLVYHGGLTQMREVQPDLAMVPDNLTVSNILIVMVFVHPV